MRPRDLNEDEIYLLVATLTVYSCPLIYLSHFLSPRLLNVAPQLSADCCAVFFPSEDVIIRHVCQMEMSGQEKKGEEKKLYFLHLLRL